MKSRWIKAIANAAVSLIYSALFYWLTKNSDITVALFIILFQIHTAIDYAVAKIKGK